jgi:crotonobetainyl-CoA:carnitine CoA-transferase CaiB-like acyl-CoA transferase
VTAESVVGRALEGVRVVDTTQGVAGPYCSHLLATLGAEVVKVEPADGDWLRHTGPPYVDGTAAAAYQLNRGKRSVALDLDTAAGTTVLLRLLRDSDVFLHDLTEEAAAARGLSPEELRAVNPHLVDCSVTAFGETGPWAELPGTELEVQSTGGVWRYLGAVGEDPVRVGADVTGILGGCAAFQAVMAALAADGPVVGQHVSTSQLAALMGVNTVMIAALDDPDTWDGFHTNAATYPRDHGVSTADGQIYWGQPLRSEEKWVAFCREIGAEDVLEDPRFATRAMRMPNQMALRQALQPYFQRYGTEELVEKVVRSDGIAVPLQDHRAVVEHPQVAALGLVAEAEGMQTLVPPWRAGDDSIAPLTAASPQVGADTAAVLAAHGFLPDELDQLVGARAVPAPDHQHHTGPTEQGAAS